MLRVISALITVDNPGRWRSRGVIGHASTIRMDSICEMPYTMIAFTCGNFLGFGVLCVGLITPELWYSSAFGRMPRGLASETICVVFCGRWHVAREVGFSNQ